MFRPYYIQPYKPISTKKIKITTKKNDIKIRVYL